MHTFIFVGEHMRPSHLMAKETETRLPGPPMRSKANTVKIFIVDEKVVFMIHDTYDRL
jgi:hypothetical protein